MKLKLGFGSFLECRFECDFSESVSGLQYTASLQNLKALKLVQKSHTVVFAKPLKSD